MSRDFVVGEKFVPRRLDQAGTGLLTGKPLKIKGETSK